MTISYIAIQSKIYPISIVENKMLSHLDFGVIFSDEDHLDSELRALSAVAGLP